MDVCHLTTLGSWKAIRDVHESEPRANQAQMEAMMRMMQAQQQGAPEEPKGPLQKKWDDFVEKHPNVPLSFSLAKNLAFFVGGVVAIRTFGPNVNLESALA